MDSEGQSSEKDSDGLFSDEDTGTKNVVYSTPNVSKISDNSSNFIGSPMLPILFDTETPGKAVVPKTPLNLIPYITKSNYQWTSDLETPEGEKTVPDCSGSPTNKMETKDLDRGQHTPPSSIRKHTESEDVSCSPIISSRKVRKRLKRRIFKSSLPTVPVMCQDEDSPKDKKLVHVKQSTEDFSSTCDNNLPHNTKINDVNDILPDNFIRRNTDRTENGISNKFYTKTVDKTFIIKPKSDNSCAGFNTASGKQIKISKQALVKAGALLSDDAENVSAKKIERFEENKSQGIGPVGFATASGKKIKVSNKALLKAEALLVEEEKTEVDKKPLETNRMKNRESRSLGFATASGKEIKISNKALSKAEALLSDELEKEKECSKQLPNFQETDNIRPVGFATAAGKKIEISNKALLKAEALLSDDTEKVFEARDSNTNKDNKQEIPKVGFSTAGGREIKISKEALVQAKSLLSEDVETVPKRTEFSNTCRSKSDLDPYSCKRKYDSDDFYVPAGTSDKWGLSRLKKARTNHTAQNKNLLSVGSCSKQQVTDKNHDGHDDKGELIASAIALIEDEEKIAEPVMLSPSKESNTKSELSKPSSPVIGSQKSNTVRKGGKKSISKSPVLEAESQIMSQKQEREINTGSNEYGDTQMMLDFIEQSTNILQKRAEAAKKQEELIEAKRKTRAKPTTGRLLSQKKANSERRITWRQIANGVAPKLSTRQELVGKNVSSDVLGVTARTALEYKLYCPDFYGQDVVQHNIDGVNTTDGGQLIFDENGYIGITEIKRSFFAQPGVDPTLVPQGWIENHYKWIVWKLASIDRMKFDSVILPRALTPASVMEQLKYRYDREIDRSERPALRKILEKDDVASRTMVLCVSSISEERNTEDAGKNQILSGLSMYNVELTDGWYSVPAALDLPMINYIKCGKIREGTKLITFGAELLNCDQGCSPLEITSEVRLKIHSNSTRRARWDTKLGYVSGIKCIPIALKNVLSNGGLISKITVTVARTYPLLYHEKTSTGESIFRNSRCEEKASIAFEQECRRKAEAIYASAEQNFSIRKKRNLTNTEHTDSLEFDWNNDWEQQEFTSKEECEEMLQKYRTKREEFMRRLESKLQETLPPPRKVTTLLKVRVIEKDTTAILSVWSPSEEIINLLKEGNGIVMLNVVAGGKRGNELQLTAGRNVLFNHHPSQDPCYSKRKCTLLQEITSSTFNPLYSEFDTLGIVSSIVSAPYGMKNFEAVNLAFPDDTSSSYLSILFWQGISTFGYSEILTIGSFIACSNIQWRRQLSQRSVPLAYCTDRSIFTRNPRQRHLQGPFESLKSVKDPIAYASESAAAISIELQKRSPTRVLGSASNLAGDGSNTSPNSKQLKHSQTSTMQGAISSSLHTLKSSTQKRLERLQYYGEPPDLPTSVLTNSSKRASLDFRSPIRKDDGKKSNEQKS